MSVTDRVGAVSLAADRASRRRRTAVERDRSAGVLIILVGAWVVLPRLLQSLAAPKLWAPAGSERAYGPVAALTVDLLLLAVLGGAAIMIIAALADPPAGRRFELVLALAPWGWLLARDVAGGGTPSGSMLVYPAVVVALWTLRPSRRVLGVVGAVVAVVVIVSAVLGLLAPDRGLWTGADGALLGTDKQLLPLGVLVGIFSQGNTLGQFVLLGLVALAALPSRVAAVGALVIAVLVITWSASRSSLVGALAVGVAVGVVVLARRLSVRWATAVAGATVVGPWLLVVIVPLVVRDELAFTARGWIWLHSLPWWRDHLITGLGSDWYARSARTTDRLGNAVFHAHNELVQLGVSGGLVLVIMVGALLAVAVRHALRWYATGSVLGIGWLVALAAGSLLEVPLGFVDNQALDPVVLLPLAILIFSVDPVS